MALTLTDPDIDRLVAELEQFGTQDVSMVVKSALQEAVDKARERAERIAALHEIVRRAHAAIKELPPQPPHGELLYDEYGLPK